VKLIAKNISKSFGPTQAINDVSITFETGQIRALVGENGSGKSTLLKVLSGVHQKDSGEITLNGKTYVPVDLSYATTQGIALVFQETTIIPYLSIAENIFIDRLRYFRNSFGLLDWSKLKNAAQQILNEIGTDINVNQEIWDLDLGQWKIIEIARALSYNPTILFLDESTAFLSAKETEAFLSVVKKLKERGLVIGFVSHYLNEVFKIADKVTILKDGKLVCDSNIKDLTVNKIEKLMVGREIDKNVCTTRKNDLSNETILSVENLRVKGKLDNVNLTLKRGEILGIAGLKGAGGECLLRVIYGDMQFNEGKMTLNGKTFLPIKPYDAVDRGIAYVPGERMTEGVIINFSVMNNLSMCALPRKGLFVDKKREKELATEYIDKMNIKAYNSEIKCTSLSGGNLQKVVIGKCLSLNPKVLLLNNPTRGIDVGARFEIYCILNRLAEKGMSIMLLSEELPELLNMSDRIAIMYKGVIRKILNKEEYTQEEDIIRYMVRE